MGKTRAVIVVIVSLVFIDAVFDGDGESSPSAQSDSGATAAPMETEESEPEPATEEEVDRKPPTKLTKPKSTETAPEPKPDRPAVRYYAVTRVVDGDTVEVARRGGTSVRIIGIDTPRRYIRRCRSSVADHVPRGWRPNYSRASKCNSCSTLTGTHRHLWADAGIPRRARRWRLRAHHDAARCRRRVHL